MTEDEIIRTAKELAICTSSDSYAFDTDGLIAFAALVAAAERKKHQYQIERWKAEAATAEKWRGLAISRDGDGRSVRQLWAEAVATEREACALVAEDWQTAIHDPRYECDCATAIRARQDEK